MMFAKIYRNSRLWVLLGLALIFPLVAPNNYWLHIANIACIFAICSLSLNLLTGCTGLFSVGHIAFYGIGAYTAAILATRFDLPFYITLPCAGLMAMLFGLVLGIPTLRLKGLYLGVATLAFGEIAYQVFVNWDSVTNGTRGILGISAPVLFGIKFGDYKSYYYLVLVFLVLIIILVRNMIHSRTGRALLSIRENAIAAEAMGINIVRYKIIAFTTSAFFAGVAGCLYAYEVHFISPESFVSAESISVLAMMVVGGIGSIAGSVAGALILSIIPEVLRSVGDVRLVLYGAAIVAIIVFAPKGLGGLIEWVDDTLSGKRSNAKKEE
ncbi:MAG: branched-chain amino acid ABC transporter permease [Acetanaerobacterium sp.]